jgi:predicted ester cyclase
VVDVSASNAELVRRHFEHMWNERDFAGCDELMADEYVEHALAPFGATAPGQVHGPTAMRETMTWLLNQFPDLTMDVEAVVSEGDVVVARVRSTGTNIGPLNGVMPPTGKAFDSVQSHWFRVADGKLAEHWATRDDLTTMVQLGIVARPGPPSDAGGG